MFHQVRISKKPSLLEEDLKRSNGNHLSTTKSTTLKILGGLYRSTLEDEIGQTVKN